MFLQDATFPLNANLPSASSLFLQPPIALRKLERMHSNQGLFQPPLLSGVNVELLNDDLWQRFAEQNTEMIITKNGRRMFPPMQINVSGLQKCEKYYVLLEIAPASDRRYKYSGYENGNNGGWSFAGPSDPQHPFERRVYTHADSPATGSHWMEKSIDFNKLKITNNINNVNNNIVLTSMHKYIPKIWIINASYANNYNELFSYPTTSFAFKKTEFIAVTAYQNAKITQLKIDHNPFAKGFRETGQSRFKRRYHQSDSNRDEGNNVSSSDSESNHANNLENSTQNSTERLTVENNTDNNARDNTKPIDANPRSPVKDENNYEVVPFHRPWLDPPHNQVTLSSHCNSDNYLRHYMYHLYYLHLYHLHYRDYQFLNHYRSQ